MLAELMDLFRSTQLSARAWLKELSRLAQCAGCGSVYVLVDGIDELSETRDNPDVAPAGWVQRQP